MRTLNRLLIGLLPLLLSACATVEQADINPPESTHAVLKLDASGEQVFRCVHDMKGWFWRFEAPNAYLFLPSTGQAPNTVIVSLLYTMTAPRLPPPESQA